MHHDLLVRHGRYLDGTGGPSQIADVAVSGGQVTAVGRLEGHTADEEIDASGCWVTPGFLDIHTHYDAEVLLAPGLGESVRHGVTTVVVGSCSLSTIHAEPVDTADLFSRVEAVPRPVVLEALDRVRTWTDATGYLAHLDSLPLGPNVAAMLGHSDLRAAVMGLGRATDAGVRPTRRELDRMAAMLADGLDAGLLGMSGMRNPWDKLDGDRYRSRRLPSTYARGREIRRLNDVLRHRGAVLQSAPNLTTRINGYRFLVDSAGFGLRPTLRTNLITAADPKSDPTLHRLLAPATSLHNRLIGSNVRWQHLPMAFDVYSDGLDLVVFEEFGAGAAALHLADELERNRLLADESYRAWFRADYERRFTPRVWHRDLHDAHITECPRPELVGRTVGAVADEAGRHVVDVFLDLIIDHGRAFRWHTLLAGHRESAMRRLADQEAVHLGFSDAGAHLRNMAFYSFPLHHLRRVYSAQCAGDPFQSLERAVWRLTGELAEWWGLDAGRLRVGDRADLVVVDPAGLDESLDGYHEAVVEEFGGLSRMVNRNDQAVRATVVGGVRVFGDGAFVPGFGTTLGTGRVLRRLGSPTSAAVGASKVGV